MDKLESKPRATWFVLIGIAAIFVAMAVLPALASAAAHVNAWAAVGTVLAIAGFSAVAVTETWRHIPH